MIDVDALEQLAALEAFPNTDLKEPSRLERLDAETDLFDFAVSGYPPELFSDVHWESYCPVSRLHEHVGEEVVACGLIVEQRIHHQETGEPIKFLSLADWTGIVETELFADTYRRYGLATVRFPVLEVRAKVEPFENKKGFSLRVLSAGMPRTIATGKPSNARADVTSGALPPSGRNETKLLAEP